MLSAVIPGRCQRVRAKRGPMTGSATKQSSAPIAWLLDCFAPLAMTNVAPYLLPGSLITRLATSLFQMNSTISAPMVAVMKPAPWLGP